MYKSSFLKVMEERGFIHQGTDLAGLDNLMSKESITAYIGFDCTAPSLHVGSLIQIMILRWLKATGHNPIVVLGGATTRVGDPSGKDEARKVLAPEEIEVNMAGIRKLIEKLIPDVTILDNSAWLKGNDFLDFSTSIGKHFSINRMLTMDSVRTRLDRNQHLSFMEFIYMMLQSYDFSYLAATHKCQLQIGGSDQWGNIVGGIKLCESLLPDAKVFGLTTPLLTNSTGDKMGKTAAGAVWIDQTMLSSFDFWQFWRNVSDADVIRFLKLFTEVPVVTIDSFTTLTGNDINAAKKILATEVTIICHSQADAELAAQTAAKTFEQGAIGDSLETVEVEIGPVLLRELLVTTGLAKSNREARDLISQNGIKIDNEVENDIDNIIIVDTEPFKLSKGKKKHIKVQGV
jgi:tyrosyl-tRNA synthetase